MARLGDLKLSHRLFMKTYRYRSVDWSPGARLVKPLNAVRLAMVSTAGLHLPDQAPFDPAIKGGDALFGNWRTMWRFDNSGSRTGARRSIRPALSKTGTWSFHWTGFASWWRAAKSAP